VKVPISWLKDFVEIDLPIEQLAQRLTIAGLEVEEIRYAGLPLPAREARPGTKISGLAWDPATIVVGAILEVMPHPNADRLVLCRLLDGEREHVVLTGAPNLFPFKGKGPLPEPIRVAYAREGAVLYDGHQPANQLMTLKRAKIRGVESYSMACSEKELGISDEHEGIIFLDDDAPAGMPLADYMGDAVLDIALTPNMARNASILGVAREVAALTGKPLHPPSFEAEWNGPAIEGQCSIEIREPELNPRFVLGLIEGVDPRPSPYRIQRRLRLAGMRPINAVVDATNYVMLELGQPLHAFDYDVLLQRSGGKPPQIITRRAAAGEMLTTLDGEPRKLDDFTVLVADGAGPLSIAGVMGGSESEVGPATRRVLLEAPAGSSSTSAAHWLPLGLARKPATAFRAACIRQWPIAACCAASSACGPGQAARSPRAWSTPTPGRRRSRRCRSTRTMSSAVLAFDSLPWRSPNCSAGLASRRARRARASPFVRPTTGWTSAPESSDGRT